MPFRSRDLFRLGAPGWILVAHLLLLLTIYRWQGLLLDKEAIKYTQGALDLLQGQASGLHGTRLFYSAYVLFLLPFVALGLPALAVVAQIALGLCAAFALRGMVLRSGASKGLADLAFAFFLLLFPIQTWVLSLYSESFFLSLSVLFFSAVTSPDKKALPVVLLGMLVLFARPVGIFWVGPLLSWALARHLGRAALAWAWGATAVVIAAVLFFPVLGPDLLRIVTECHGIGGFPRYPDGSEGFRGATLASAEWHVAHRHGALVLAEMAGQRVAWLYLAGRPYFSALHNALLFPVLLLHPFAAATLVRHWRRPMVQLTAMILLLNTFIVALTFAEWNGRFLVPLLPLLILLGAIGAPWPGLIPLRPGALLARVARGSRPSLAHSADPGQQQP